MNRIALLAPSQAKQSAPAFSAAAAIRETRSSQVSQQYSLFVPLHYERNYAYPLLVWLHGPGDDERQLRRIMPHVSVRNYVGVAPRGTLNCEDGLGCVWQQDESQIQEARMRVEECIDLACQRLNIARQRVFIGGYECGGTMALRLATLDPQCFAGAISIGGAFPEGGMPLAQLARLRRLPLFLGHSRDSEQYPASRLCEQLRMFHVAGLAVNVFQYPCGDEVTTKMLSDIDVWMMERVTGVVHEPSEPVFFGSTNPN